MNAKTRTAEKSMEIRYKYKSKKCFVNICSSVNRNKLLIGVLEILSPNISI